MENKIVAIDTYISKSAEFAQPILNHLRELVHKTCPGVEEKIKWGFPHFDYKNEMMCSMAAFKQHCVFGFWKAALMKDPVLLETAKSEVAMGHLGKITTLKDLPPGKTIKAWIKEAMLLNESGIKLPSKARSSGNKEISVPGDLMEALEKHSKAKQLFDNYTYSHKKEYIDWIMEAKTTITRDRRIATAIKWLKEGKSRNWKYQAK